MCNQVKADYMYKEKINDTTIAELVSDRELIFRDIETGQIRRCFTIKGNLEVMKKLMAKFDPKTARFMTEEEMKNTIFVPID